MKKKAIKIKMQDLASKNYSKAIEIPVRISLKEPNFLFPLIRKSLVKFTAFILIVALNWTGLSAVYQTFAYFNDTETSIGNTFQAGILNFELQPLADFPAVCSNEPAERTISIVNYGNPFKYAASSTEFSGVVCDYVTLEANVDGGDPEYVGPLTEFNYGPLDFSDPDDWVFKATFNPDLPAGLLGQTCTFKFVFDGSQTKNDLPFGQGFSDSEEITSNITAKACCYTEIRSCGYWKTHSDVYKPHLPQTLGGYPKDEIIDTVAKADNILTAACGNCGRGCDKTMRDKLKGQLLAMKFNIAHFGIGGYIDASTTPKTLDDIVADADNLLRDPNPVLEEMKNLLDYLNNLVQIRYCVTQFPQVTVLVPNGGEQWWVGHYYDIKWTTSNLNCPNDASEVSIWYSADSGATFANIVASTENDGIYNWRAPLSINGYYVPSSNARIKIVARCSENQMVVGWDMSDADFCPPIDYDLLTDEEKAQIEQLLADGILTEEDIINREATTSEESIIDENVSNKTTAEETTSTTTDEIINEIPGGTGGETTQDVIEEPASANEEVPAEETLAVEEQPATEEQPVDAPSNDSSQNEPAGGSDDSDGGDGSSSDSTAVSVDNGGSESLGDSGNNLGE